MEDHTTTDSTLGILAGLRGGLPRDGRGAAGVPAPHRGRLPGPGRAGSRVRLCKGAYREPESVAFQSRSEVDRAYVRA